VDSDKKKVRHASPILC